MTEFHRLSDERYAKLKGQTRSRFNAALATIYSMHGYRDYAPMVTEILMDIVEESWDIVRGKEKPLPVPDLRRWE